MVEYSIGPIELGKESPSDFEEIISIVKGLSITSAGEWKNTNIDRFEFGLSGNMIIRFFGTGRGIKINLISTLNKGEIPSAVLALGDMPQHVPISIIEKKLNGLRTLYAIFYLIETGREKELQSYFIRHPHGDIENALLKEDERLFIESISYGSWIVTIWTKTKAGFNSIRSVIGLAFERGREAYLSKMEAEAKLTQAKAIREEVETAKEIFRLKKEQCDYLMEVSEKIDIPEVKETIRNRMIAAAQNLTLGDKFDSETPKKLR